LNDYTAAIVGAGPVGVELAVALKRAGIDWVHLEAGQIGAAMLAWPPATRWFSSPERIAIAGVPIQSTDQTKCTREEYLAYLRTVVLQFDLPIRTFEWVESIQREAGRFQLTTRKTNGTTDTIGATNVILSTGGMTRVNRLDIPGEDLPHVSHQMDDPHCYFRKRVLIVGGRNSAAEAALRLHRAGAQVVSSYRGDALGESVKYWLRPELELFIKKKTIESHFRTEPIEITPNAVMLRSIDDGQTFQVECDFVLLLTGYLADMSLFREADVELVGNREVPVFDESTMETNVPGLYVAGTATAGTQQSGVRVFLENCHIHVDRIVAALSGATPPATPVPVELPEA
jgi:thioredoxin reductase (NADPH)